VRTATAGFRDPAAVMIVTAVALLSVAVASGRGAKEVAPLVIAVVVLATLHRVLFQWQGLVGMIVVILLFIPVGRYRLPGNLPFDLELYRVMVALIVLAWLTALLIDQRVRLRATAFDRPILLIGVWILASDLANPGRVNAYGSYVAKTLTFYLSFILVYYITATAIRQRESLLLLLRLMAGGGAIIGALGLIEREKAYNAFDHLHSLLPFLILQPSLDTAILRGGNLRVFGSAEHPIALGALLTMLIPISVYLTKAQGRRWMIATMLLLLGALATGSRTAITMLLAQGILYFIYKRRETLRILPLLAPAVVLVHGLLPGAIGGFRAAFFPKGGIIAQQSQLGATENGQLAGGRIRLIGPMVAEASRHPLFGEGMGTRITGFNVKNRNAPILDNQWLNNLLDVGYIGFGLWIWLFVMSVRKLLSRARKAPSDDPDSWLFLGLGAAIFSFAIGMLTFDAFGYTQIFFIFWILLGISSALLAAPERAAVVSRVRPTLRPATG
jgi:O-Antigen ligase